MTSLPVLYSFRRCPYAIRARLAILRTGVAVELREVLLRNKAPEFLASSPKGTVPVLVLPDGFVIEESLDIMDWALAQDDCDGFAATPDQRALIEDCETDFKPHLDRYKYHTRYDDADPEVERTAAAGFVARLEEKLTGAYLAGYKQGQVDIAIAPFVRQFANTDRNWFDTQPWPGAHRWLRAFETSATFAAVMDKRPPWQSGDPVTLFPGPTRS